MFQKIRICCIAFSVFVLTVSGLQAAKLVWETIIPVWKPSDAGLSCDLTNRSFVFSTEAGKQNPTLSIYAVVPRNSRNPDTIRLNFDIASGMDQYAFGLSLFERKKGSCKLAVFRDGDKVLVEFVIVTNNRQSVVKKILPIAEVSLRSRDNELVWHRKTGRFVLNGRQIYQAVTFPSIRAERTGISAVGRVVFLRRLRFQITSRAINSASQTMSENSITVLDETFKSSTVIKWILGSSKIIEEAGSAMDIMGP